MSAAASAARPNRSPGARCRQTRSGWGLRQRLERERPDQHEAEDEAAMQVRPQGHQRGKRERRRAAAIAGGEEAGAPGGRNRQRQHMRARQQARRHQPETEPDGRDERRAAKLARGAKAHDQRRAGRGGAGHEHNAAPAAEAESERQQYFGQPFMRDPRRARRRVAERVRTRRGAVGDDPFARRQMREGVAVAEHRRREGREREQGNRDRSEAEPGKAGLGALIASGADQWQGEGHRLSLPKLQ